MTADAPVRFRASADALATRVGDEIVLVHTLTDKIYVLNGTGARVWELLCEDLDPRQIAARLEGEFDVARRQLTAEIDDLIAALVLSRLISGLADG